MKTAKITKKIRTILLLDTPLCKMIVTKSWIEKARKGKRITSKVNRKQTKSNLNSKKITLVRIAMTI